MYLYFEMHDECKIEGAEMEARGRLLDAASCALLSVLCACVCLTLHLCYALCCVLLCVVSVRGSVR
jgi:hypothetical protein